MHEILLVEDNEAIILGLEYLLKQEGYHASTARNVLEAEKAILERDYHLMLLDVSLPDGSGFDFYRRMKGRVELPVIFLTALEEEADVVRGLDMGAEDYITKPFRNKELLSRIRKVLRHSRQAQSVLRCGDIALNTETGRVSRGGEEITLTKLEYRILSSLLSCQGKLFTREEILSEVWDSSGNFVNDNTLSVTMKRIREKLGDTEGQIIRTVRGIGYRMEKQ